MHNCSSRPTELYGHKIVDIPEEYTGFILKKDVSEMVLVIAEYSKDGDYHYEGPSEEFEVSGIYDLLNDPGYDVERKLNDIAYQFGSNDFAIDYDIAMFAFL